jgi:hypothetical protein
MERSRREKLTRYERAITEVSLPEDESECSDSGNNEALHNDGRQ